MTAARTVSTVRLHLVRHAQAASGWGTDLDPGLSVVGQAQAEAVGIRLASTLTHVSVRTSPLRRARQTAAALEQRWGVVAEIDGAFGEIPSPTTDLAERAAWLSSALAGGWGELDGAVAAWRRNLLSAVRALEEPIVAFTHFVAINAVVAEAQHRSEVTVFAPANASVTVIDVDRSTGRLLVVQLGDEAPPTVG